MVLPVAAPCSSAAAPSAAAHSVGPGQKEGTCPDRGRWNPAVERQAADRIHRLGQFRPITVIRFVVSGTIEDRLLKLQEKKMLVFESTVGRSTDALSRLTAEDLAFLFQ